MILFCNVVCVYVHKICEEKFAAVRVDFHDFCQKLKYRMIPRRGNIMGGGVPFAHRRVPMCVTVQVQM